MDCGCVYCISFDNKLFYIGQTTNFYHRKHYHLSNLKLGKHNNEKLRNAFNNSKEIKFIKLEYCDNKNDLLINETKWFNFYLKKYGRENMLNMGATGFAHNTCAETRNKIGIAGKGRHKSKKMEFKKGFIPWNKGTKGIMKPNKTSFKKGQNAGKNSFVARKVKQLTLDGVLLNIFDTIKEASESVGVNRACINECCLGTQKTSKGFLWEYA